MSKAPGAEPIIQTCTINKSVSDSFSAFVDDFPQWYPAEYTWAQDGLQTIRIEPFENGRCFERGPNGFELDWGRVLTYRPPSLLIFSWQIDANRVPIPDAANAGDVQARFEPDDNSTRVVLEHRHFEKYKQQPQTYRDALASPQGWPYILDCFKQYCGKD